MRDRGRDHGDLRAQPDQPGAARSPGSAGGPQTSVTLNSGVDSFTDSGPFRDNVNWTSGDKTISMGPGTDSTFVTGIGNDVVDAGAGDDDITQAQFSDGADVLDGGAGDDRLVYSSGATSPGVSISIDGQPNDGRPGEGDNAIGFERLLGTSGNDTLIGDDSANDLNGSGGDDVLIGLGGSDGLIGNDGNDSLVGGEGRDDLSCGLGFDSVVADPFDVIAAECERRGAEVQGATAAVKGKGTAKVRITCPLEEGSPCIGNVVLFQGGRQIGTGAFEVGNGQTAVASVKLSKPGRKLLLRNDGSLFVTAEAQTNEALGLNVNDARVLLSR